MKHPPNFPLLRYLGALFAALLLAVSSISTFADESNGASIILVQTDKTGYLAGETVTVQGAGFTSGDLVTVKISHAEAPSDSDPTWTVTPDSLGAFTLVTEWSIDPYDSAGNAFVVTATGTSGAVESAFRRIAVLQTDRFDYQRGEMALISGAGFRPSETVTLDVTHMSGLADGPAHAPFATGSGGNGQVSGIWPVPLDETLGSIFSLTAVGSDSGLTALTFFTDPPITIVDDKGPDDYPGQKDLNQLQVDKANLPASQAISWNWDDTAWSGNNTGDACSLFDTNGDGKANYSLCVIIGGSPATYQSTQLYSCGNSQSDRCDQPAEPISTFTSTCLAAVVSNSDPFGVPTSPYYAPLHVSGNTCGDNPGCYTADTVAACTVRMTDFGNPLSAFLINVCSYPSGEPNSAPSECVITPNNGFLTIVKKVTSTADQTVPQFTFNLGSGQTSQNGQSSWTITLTEGTSGVWTGSVPLISFAPGTTYDLTEAIPEKWKLDSVSCAIQTSSPTPTGTPPTTTPVPGSANAGVTDFAIQSGLETICTFTDSIDESQLPANLKLVKTVTNDNDGTAVATDWTLTAAGNQTYSGPGGFEKSVDPDTYVLSEGGPSGYMEGTWTCSGTGSYTFTAPNQIKVEGNANVTCTINNNDQPPSLALVKTVTNDNGGTAAPTAFTLTATGPTTISGAGGATSNGTFKAGTYTLSETNLAGYTAGSWSCTGGAFTAPDKIALAIGQSATCTINNDDQAAHLKLVKVVVNDNGGTQTEAAWTLSAAGPTHLSGAGPTVESDVNAGSYTLSESGPSGYSTTGYDCGVSVTLALGETRTCTITNDDQQAYVKVVKVVNNTYGGTAKPDDFKLTLDSVVTTSGTLIPVVPGTHTAAETPLYGYTFNGFSGDCDSSGNVTVALGVCRTNELKLYV